MAMGMVAAPRCAACGSPATRVELVVPGQVPAEWEQWKAERRQAFEKYRDQGRWRLLFEGVAALHSLAPSVPLDRPSVGCRPCQEDACPHRDGGPCAGDDRPTWDPYRRMADSPNVRPERREAILWALGQLERRMGPDWLERYWESAGHVPPEVNLGSGHVAALGNLLDLALRYHVLDGAPGIGQVQRDMRNDLRDERRWHSSLQLEVAALGTRAGFTAALEARPSGRGGPSDVILRRDGQLLQVETFAVLRDKRSRGAAEYWDWLMAEIRNIGWRSGAGVSGDLGERALQVGEVKLSGCLGVTGCLGVRGDGDDPRGGAGFEQVQEQAGEQEPGEVVHGEGALKPVCGDVPGGPESPRRC
jgi:hypothetical protein